MTITIHVEKNESLDINMFADNKFNIICNGPSHTSYSGTPAEEITPAPVNPEPAAVEEIPEVEPVPVEEQDVPVEEITPTPVNPEPAAVEEVSVEEAVALLKQIKDTPELGTSVVRSILTAVGCARVPELTNESAKRVCELARSALNG